MNLRFIDGFNGRHSFRPCAPMGEDGGDSKVALEEKKHLDEEEHNEAPALALKNKATHQSPASSRERLIMLFFILLGVSATIALTWFVWPALITLIAASLLGTTAAPILAWTVVGVIGILAGILTLALGIGLQYTITAIWYAKETNFPSGTDQYGQRFARKPRTAFNYGYKRTGLMTWYQFFDCFRLRPKKLPIDQRLETAAAKKNTQVSKLLKFLATHPKAAQEQKEELTALLADKGLGSRASSRSTLDKDGNLSLDLGIMGRDRLSESDIDHLVKILEQKDSPLVELNLAGQQLGDQAAIKLARALKGNTKLQVLKLDRNNITDAGATALAGTLGTNTSRLVQLSLTNNQITAPGVLSLCAALEKSGSGINLNLDLNDIGDEGRHALERRISPFRVAAIHPKSDLTEKKVAAQLQSTLATTGRIGPDRPVAASHDLSEVEMQTITKLISGALPPSQAVTTVNLSHQKLTLAGHRYLGEALKGNKTVMELKLTHTQLNDEGALALAEAVKAHPSLRVLDLGMNLVGDRGATALAEGSKQLTSLNLRTNRIGNAGAIAFATALQDQKSPSSLQNLDFNTNQLGDEAALAFAEALKVNKTLRTLSLGPFVSTNPSLPFSATGISDRGFIALAEAMKTNFTLTSLRLDESLIKTEAGWKAHLVIQVCLERNRAMDKARSKQLRGAGRVSAVELKEDSERKDDEGDEGTPQAQAARAIAHIEAASYARDPSAYQGSGFEERVVGEDTAGNPKRELFQFDVSFQHPIGPHFEEVEKAPGSSSSASPPEPSDSHSPPWLLY